MFPLVLGPVNSWSLCIPSSVLNLGRRLGSTDLHPWVTFWSLSWGVKLGHFYDSLQLFTTSQESLFFVTKLCCGNYCFKYFFWFVVVLGSSVNSVLCCSILAGSRIPHVLVFALKYDHFYYLISLFLLFLWVYIFFNCSTIILVLFQERMVDSGERIDGRLITWM